MQATLADYDSLEIDIARRWFYNEFVPKIRTHSETLSPLGKNQAKGLQEGIDSDGIPVQMIFSDYFVFNPSDLYICLLYESRYYIIG